MGPFTKTLTAGTTMAITPQHGIYNASVLPLGDGCSCEITGSDTFDDDQSETISLPSGNGAYNIPAAAGNSLVVTFKAVGGSVLVSLTKYP